MPSESVEPTTEARGSGNDSGSPGLSQVLGRILQQLSVSAWMPAAMLVGNVSVQLQLRADGDYNIAKAVRELAGKPLGTIIILAFALILATVVMQAFELKAIRFLEGYTNSSNGFVQAVATMRIQRHKSKREVLDSKLKQAEDKALPEAICHMRQYSAYDPIALDYLLKKPLADSAEYNVNIVQAAKGYDWRAFASGAERYRMASITRKLSSYPAERRILPTRLGNVLRAAEDKLGLPGDLELQLYVIRYYDLLPLKLRSQHDEYRTRLDMYCSLALVFSLLAVVSIVIFSGMSPLWGMVIAAVGYGLMAFLSYEAAIASALTYGLMLQEIHNYLTLPEVPDEAR